MMAGGNHSLFIMQYYGILGVWLPGTTHIINKKEVWLAFQGNNESRSGRSKQKREGDEKLIFKFVWPYGACDNNCMHVAIISQPTCRLGFYKRRSIEVTSLS